MTNDEIKGLCLRLMKSDTEEEVIQHLNDVGLWDDLEAWRFYGDQEGNYSTIGNQSSKPDAAMVEKIVNSVDARLMNECLVRGIDPLGSECPQSIREAVNAFFEDDVRPDSPVAGLISEWPDSQRTNIARSITLSATGAKPPQKPCFTIADSGEGQTPAAFPNTFLSLPDKSNKLRIPFVQGKFNMGGTAALAFCRDGLQLILSRRNPLIVQSARKSDFEDHWGFTIVRRENPSAGARSSVFTYLAPNGCGECHRKGDVLHFAAENMPIFPKGTDAYARQAAWGTLVKLYEYSTTGYSGSHILLKGLNRRLDVLLHRVGLPIRLHECRDFKGGRASFETTLTGLSVRLQDDKAENLEAGFPSSAQICVGGQTMRATIYAFKRKYSDTYLTNENEGVIFTVNGQTHGHLTRDFFRRKRVGNLGYINRSILVALNCDEISGRSREDLFMNCRNRLRGSELRIEIERCLEELLKEHAGLRELQNRRREEEIQSKLVDSKPLEDILESLLKQSPTLASLFLLGQRVTSPFASKKTGSEQKEHKGKRYPTYFRFRGKDSGVELHRECHVNIRCRLTFETDATNDYLSRKIDQGDFSVFLDSGGVLVPVNNSIGPSLYNGIATLTISLPETCVVGDVLRYKMATMDSSRVEPIKNSVRISVIKPASKSGGSGKRSNPPSEKEGQSRETSGKIALPQIHRVKEEDWAIKDPPFDKYTSLRIKRVGDDVSNNGNDAYEFFVNVDNVYLKSELKTTKSDVSLVCAKFVFGMVLLGLGLLQGHAEAKKIGKDNDGDELEDGMPIEEQVESTTRALAPVLLPMIEELGGLDLAEAAYFDTSGEAD